MFGYYYIDKRTARSRRAGEDALTRRMGSTLWLEDRRVADQNIGGAPFPDRLYSSGLGIGGAMCENR